MAPSGVGDVEQRTVFPSSRYSRCFDLFITGCGYNSFHECLLGNVPTVFVPNEAPELDDQLLRARYAESMQLARCLRTRDVPQVGSILTATLSPAARADLQNRMSRLKSENGALTIARYLEEHLYSVRADGPLADVIDRI
jgi:predicted glycosyltransferase